MNKVIDKGFRRCRFVSTIVKHPVYIVVLRAHAVRGESHIQHNTIGKVTTPNKRLMKSLEWQQNRLQRVFCRRF